MALLTGTPGYKLANEVPRSRPHCRDLGSNLAETSLATVRDTPRRPRRQGLYEVLSRVELWASCWWPTRCRCARRSCSIWFTH